MEDPDGVKFCRPCGLCRQLVFENARLSKLRVDVVMCNLKGAYEVSLGRSLRLYREPRKLQALRFVAGKYQQVLGTTLDGRPNRVAPGNWRNAITHFTFNRLAGVP